MEGIIDKLRELWEKRGFRVAIYLTFGLFSFMMFLVATFPKQRVAQIASVQLEALMNHEYDVQISEIRFWRLSGVQARSVVMREREAGERSDSAGPARMIQIERISGRVAPIRSLLAMGLVAHVQVDVGGGLVNAHYTRAASGQKVRVRMNRLDLRQSTLLAGLLGVPIFGEIDGDIDLELGPRGTPKAGEISITARQLTLVATTVRSEQIPVFTSLDLPTTNFGNLRARITVEELDAARGASRLNIEEFQSQGNDLSLQLWGHVDMVPGSTRPRLQMRMQLAERYVTENSLGFLLNMQDFRSGLVQNWYGFEFGGTTENLQFSGSREAARGPSGAAPAPAEEDAAANEGVEEDE